MKKLNTFILVILAPALCFSVGSTDAEKGTADNPFTLSELTAEIDKLEDQEVVLTGTILGACKSGCKMWVAEGEYKEGEAYALVRAKDDAFKFDTAAAGKTAVLHGFGVAKYMDYCAETGKEQEGAMDKCETPMESNKEVTEEPKVKEEAEERKVKEITFFATKVEYH